MLRASFYTAATSLLFVAAGVATSIVLARALGPEGRGAYASAILVVTLASSIGQLGLGTGYVYMARRTPRWAGLKVILGSAATAGVVSAALAASMVRFLAAGEARESPGWIVSLAAVQAIQSFATAALQLDPRLVSFNLLRVAPPLIGVAVLGGLFLVCKPNVESALVVQCVGMAAGALLSGAALLKLSVLKLSAPGLPAGAGINGDSTTAASVPESPRKTYIGYSLQYHSTVVVGLLVQNLDKVALARLGGVAELGIYALAYNVSRLLGTIQDAISISLFSKFAGTGGKALQGSSAVAFRESFVPLLSLAAVFSLALPELIPRLYGAAFAAAVVPCIVLAFESVISGAGWILAQRFAADGMPGLVLVRQLASLAPIGLAFVVGWPHLLSTRLALAMLESAVLRLVLTATFYRFVLREPIPGLWPRWSRS